MSDKSTAGGSREGYVLDASLVAKPFLEEIKRAIKNSFPEGKGPLMVGLLANQDPFARMYAKWTKKACEFTGCQYRAVEVKRTELEDKIYELNEDKNVHGIMVYYPVFGTNTPSFMGGVTMDNYLASCIEKEKDVEGLSFTYMQALYKNKRSLQNARGDPVKSVLPCTPLAVVKILEYLGVYVDEKKASVGQRLKGKTVTVINRSQIVGHPLAAMLANDGAQVYSKDVDSMFLFKQDERGRGRLFETDVDIDTALRASDVIVAGVPSKKYKVPLGCIKEGTVFINVSSFQNVDKKGLLNIPGVVYVPKVGKATVAMLQRNLLRLYQGYHSPA